MNKEAKLVKFIKDNHLSFNGTAGSDLNSDCTIISGYALHLGVSDTPEIKRAIWEAKQSKKSNFIEELDRVFEFADNNDYGYNWSSPEYKKMYKF